MDGPTFTIGDDERPEQTMTNDNITVCNNSGSPRTTEKNIEEETFASPADPPHNLNNESSFGTVEAQADGGEIGNNKPPSNNGTVSSSRHTVADSQKVRNNRVTRPQRRDEKLKRGFPVFLSNIPENADVANIFGAIRAKIGKFKSCRCKFLGDGVFHISVRKLETREKLLREPIQIFGVQIKASMEQPCSENVAQSFVPVYLSNIPESCTVKKLMGMVKKAVGDFVAMNKVVIENGCSKITFNYGKHQKLLLEKGLAADLAEVKISTSPPSSFVMEDPSAGQSRARADNRDRSGSSRKGRSVPRRKVTSRDSGTLTDTVLSSDCRSRWSAMGGETTSDHQSFAGGDRFSSGEETSASSTWQEMINEAKIAKASKNTIPRRMVYRNGAVGLRVTITEKDQDSPSPPNYNRQSFYSAPSECEYYSRRRNTSEHGRGFRASGHPRRRSRMSDGMNRILRDVSGVGRRLDGIDPRKILRENRKLRHQIQMIRDAQCPSLGAYRDFDELRLAALEEELVMDGVGIGDRMWEQEAEYDPYMANRRSFINQDAYMDDLNYLEDLAQFGSISDSGAYELRPYARKPSRKLKYFRETGGLDPRGQPAPPSNVPSSTPPLSKEARKE